jgi:hypothetical protein
VGDRFLGLDEEQHSLLYIVLEISMRVMSLKHGAEERKSNYQNTRIPAYLKIVAPFPTMHGEALCYFRLLIRASHG